MCEYNFLKLIKAINDINALLHSMHFTRPLQCCATRFHEVFIATVSVGASSDAFYIITGL